MPQSQEPGSQVPNRLGLGVATGRPACCQHVSDTCLTACMPRVQRPPTPDLRPPPLLPLPPQHHLTSPSHPPFCPALQTTVSGKVVYKTCFKVNYRDCDRNLACCRGLLAAVDKVNFDSTPQCAANKTSIVQVR